MSKEPKQPEPWQIEDAGRLKEFFAKQDKSQAQFGYEHEIGTQGMVWQYLTAKRPLNIEAAVAFARGLGVGIADFSPTIAAKIRDAASVIAAPGSGTSNAPGAGPQWIDPDAYRLLDIYSSLDDEQKAHAMRMIVSFTDAGRQSAGDGAQS